MVTCEAPLANAALTSSAITKGIASVDAVQLEPNGPNSTVAPTASAADTAAVTCGPGRPSTNGSTVNSSCSTPEIYAESTPIEINERPSPAEDLGSEAGNLALRHRKPAQDD